MGQINLTWTYRSIYVYIINLYTYHSILILWLIGRVIPCGHVPLLCWMIQRNDHDLLWLCELFVSICFNGVARLVEFGWSGGPNLSSSPLNRKSLTSVSKMLCIKPEPHFIAKLLWSPCQDACLFYSFPEWIQISLLLNGPSTNHWVRSMTIVAFKMRYKIAVYIIPASMLGWVNSHKVLQLDLSTWPLRSGSLKTQPRQPHMMRSSFKNGRWNLGDEIGKGSITGFELL